MNTPRQFLTTLATVAFLVVGGLGIYRLWSSGRPAAFASVGTPSTGVTMTANIVFNTPGEYRSQRGSEIVRILPNGPNELVYEVESPHGTSRKLTPFSPHSGWFMCWDDAGQLWFYNPDEGPQYCSVHYWVNHAGTPTTGVRTCGELGGWDGIPSEFLNRLPDVARATYEQAQQLQAGQTSPARPAGEAVPSQDASAVE